MLQSGFVVAMRATIDVASYERPTTIVRQKTRWLIVSRLGSDGELLTISDTGVTADVAAEAPIGLAPLNTLIGILASREQDFDSVFLFSRQKPAGLGVAGVFFPAEGYAQLQWTGELLRFGAKGRHAHSRGHRDGREILHDVACPAPDAELSMAWHIDATHCPWAGEFFARQAR